MLFTALLAAVSLSPSARGGADLRGEVLAELELLPDNDGAALIRHLDGVAETLAAGADVAEGRAGLQQVFFREVAASLYRKRTDPLGAFTLTDARLRRTVVDYEAFKLQAYTSSGVFPKRYFGYFDLRWDSAEHEAVLARVSTRAAELINAHQAARGAKVRVTPAEIAVTFVSEGGALLLREQQEHADDVHPVFGVGLDDIAIGSDQHSEVVEALDREFGTDLAGIVVHRDGQAWLTRNMNFEEAILGTAFMWLYEKEIAQRKLLNEGRKGLEERPLDEQFILASLVYNSGILFGEQRVRMVRDFRTADYLSGVSTANRARRQELNLLGAAKLVAELAGGGGYREQHTSWNAVYHILQRYGGYVGLKRFTDTFDAQDRFVVVPPEPPPPPEPAPAPTLPVDVATDAGGCSSAGGLRAGAVSAFLGLLLSRGRRRER